MVLIFCHICFFFFVVELRDFANTTSSARNIDFRGHRDDIPNILEHTTVFALPTLGEGMSNALLEAMAAGIPCVTTDIPANRALVRHNQTGVLVPPQDPNRLAQSILNLLENPERRFTIGSMAKKHAQEHHNPEKIADSLHGILKQYAR